MPPSSHVDKKVQEQEEEEEDEEEEKKDEEEEDVDEETDTGTIRRVDVSFKDAGAANDYSIS